MMPGRSFRAACLAGLVSLAFSSTLAPIGAQEYSVRAAPGDALDRVRSMVAERLGVAPARVRVSLTGVDDPVVTLGSADSLTIRAGDSGRWTLVAWSAGHPSARLLRVGVAEQVAVAARDLARGRAITEDDVQHREDVLWDGASPPEDPIGFVAERRVRAGERLEEPAVRPPFLVRGGDPVEALLEMDGIRIRVRAEALASARVGGRLHVRLESGRRVEATAIDAGLVRLDLGGTR